MPTLRKIVRRWDDTFGRVEQAILVSLLLIMVGLAFVQIVLRVFFASGIIWADVALRHLVLWVALFGATVATRESKHIHIDVLPRLLSGRARTALSVLIDFSSAFVSGLLTLAGFKFVSDEFLVKTTTFLQIPGWITAIIFPLAFSIITIHFTLNGLAKVMSLGESDS